MDLKEYYINRIDKLKTEIEKLKKSLRLLSLYRLSSFLFSFLQFFIFYEINAWLSFGVFLISFGVFIFFIRKYNSISFRTELLIEKLSLNTNELNAQNWDYSGFDSGIELDEAKHAFVNDLDIFLEQGFFQSINRSSSLRAKQLLAESIINPLHEEEYIKKRQETVKELSSKNEWGQDFLAFCHIGLDGTEREKLNTWLSSANQFLQKRGLNTSRFVIPAIALVLIGLYIFNLVSFSIISIVVVINFTIIGFYLNKINKIHALTGKQYQNFRNFAQLIHLISAENFQSDELIQIKHKVIGEKENTILALKELAAILKRFDYRLNMILAILINGILMWDLQCVFQLEKWKNKYAVLLPEWLDSIYQIESLVSMGNYAFNHPDFTFPVYQHDAILSSKELGHPLLISNQRVNNDFEIKTNGSFTIITGANMAGKSTFLRTVGLNLVMAYAGLPVCAKEFKFSFFELFTSMRTSDSLSKNESYFYAELKRLKELLEIINGGKRVFVILDEILKGTNSADKQEGSKMFLKQLINKKATGIIATHDLELASLEGDFPAHVTNKCFEIEIEKDQIFFDYKLYDGVTQKMNASLLMKQMGIV